MLSLLSSIGSSRVAAGDPSTVSTPATATGAAAAAEPVRTPATA